MSILCNFANSFQSSFYNSSEQCFERSITISITYALSSNARRHLSFSFIARVFKLVIVSRMTTPVQITRTGTAVIGWSDRHVYPMLDHTRWTNILIIIMRGREVQEKGNTCYVLAPACGREGDDHRNNSVTRASSIFGAAPFEQDKK